MGNPRFEVAIGIAAPIEQVYATVADFPRHVEWANQLATMTPLQSGPPRVGSIYRTDEQIPRDLALGMRLIFRLMNALWRWRYGSDGHTEATITALDAPHRVAWRARYPSRRHGDLMRMEWEIELRADDHGTHLVQRCEICPPPESPTAFMVRGKRGRQTVEYSRQQVRANLQSLKQMMEQAHLSADPLTHS